MAQQYVGNNDFRGYLLYLAQNGDDAARLALNYTGNDGGVDRGNLNEWNQAAPGANVTDQQLQDAAAQKVADYYAAWQGIQNPAQNRAGGGSSSTYQDKIDEQNYWQDQMNLADQQIARLCTQEQTGNTNIDNSYNSAYNRLVGDKEVTERDYNTKRGQTVEDNIAAKNNINTSVRNRNTGLQRLLGSKGAGNSSAAQILAPYAAAKEGNTQRQQVQTAYSRNIGGLDTAWGDYQNDWKDSVTDLGTQRDTQKQNLRTSIMEKEASLQQEKSNAAVQKAQAGGQNYTQARNARAPYMTRINQLISAIDSLGVNPVLQAKQATYKAPTLSDYTYDRYGAPTLGSGVDPGLAQGAGAYWTLLGNNDKKKEQTVV